MEYSSDLGDWLPEWIEHPFRHGPGHGGDVEADNLDSDNFATASIREPHHAVTEPVEGFAAVDGQAGFLGLVDFGEGVEEAPWAELLVRGHPPFGDQVRHLARGDGPAVHGANDKIEGGPVGNRAVTVGIDAVIKALEDLNGGIEFFKILLRGGWEIEDLDLGVPWSSCSTSSGSLSPPPLLRRQRQRVISEMVSDSGPVGRLIQRLGRVDRDSWFHL